MQFIYPGGKKSIKTLKKNDAAINFINEAFKHCKTIGAMSEGIKLINNSNIKGVKTAKNGEDGITSDFGVITATEKINHKKFIKSFIESIEMHRNWDRELSGLSIIC